MNGKSAKELLALLKIAQARREERTINEVQAELAARAFLGVSDWEGASGGATLASEAIPSSSRSI